jgi:hypothetical protein
MMRFSGSYEPGDVTFLLKVVDIATTDVAEKERLIQAGTHYSEMLSDEKSPTADYLRLFHRSLAMNSQKMGQHIADLAATMAVRPGREVVVVSLARAGTPVGVLIHRALHVLGRQSKHYCVSIIRDRGIDWEALDYICANHKDTDIVFVDGWTGKGVITAELLRSVTAYNESRGRSIDPSLWVLADLAGSATVAATAEDYLIPNAVLNATVSGLVSRTVLSDLYVQPGDFHACAFYGEKQAEDLSRFYVDEMTPHVITALSFAKQAKWTPSKRRGLNQVSTEFVAAMMARYDAERNHVKPGIGESTRAMLRRVPDRLLVADNTAEDVQHLLRLADEKDVHVERISDMPYRAAVIIKSVGE